MRVALPDWTALAHFAAIVLTVTLYGLCVAVHFPAEHRQSALRTGIGGIILWGTMTLVALAGLAALQFAWTYLPIYAAVIAGGLAVLAAPICLQPFPDHFVDGRLGLVTLAALSAALAAITVLL